jgi:L,D-transpeptidase YcbB
MKKTNSFLFILICVLFFTNCTQKQQIKDQQESNEDIQALKQFNRLRDTAALFLKESIDGYYEDKTNQAITLINKELTPKHYTTHSFYPVWFTHLNSLKQINEFIEFIKEIEFHGLLPSDYHYDSLLSYSNQLNNNLLNSESCPSIATMDILLTDAFIAITTDLYKGKLTGETIQKDWGIQDNKPELNHVENLNSFLKAININDFMKKFYPTHSNYQLMVEHVRYLDSKREGDYCIAIPDEFLPLKFFIDTIFTHEVNKRLLFLGLTDKAELDYSDSLIHFIEAVKRLQYIHGLNTDGEIGKRTLRALNLSIPSRIKKLYVNMERLRWMPNSIDQRYIMVNIADYTLALIEGKDTLLQMRTVVGKEYRKTPVFNGRMTYLVFSPTWTVPPGILRNDIIPAVSKNSSYLLNKEMVILDSKGNTVDVSSIDWKKAQTGSFPYRIRQAPGKQNSLGKVKFMFPNTHNVYLHDTPSRDLFAKDERTFSSGCIRIEKPFELAKKLLEHDENWTDELISAAMNQKQEKTVILKQPVEVYIYYLTAWGNGNNTVHFRYDVYTRDEQIYKALKTPRSF